MDNLKSFKIKIALLVVAIICFAIGLEITENSKYNENKITITVIDAQVNESDANQSINLTCSIENNAGTTVKGIEANISFKNKSGEAVGALHVTFGSTDGAARALCLEPKNTITQTVRFGKNSGANDLYTLLYNGKLSELNISYEIAHVYWGY